jgi:hypothetical protein
VILPALSGRLRTGASTGLLAWVLGSCSVYQDSATAEERLPTTPARLNAATQLREMVVSSPDASFTVIPRVAVDSRGNIYVPDTYRQRVTVLAPDGRLLRTIGRRGSGPDEFQSLQSLQILPGDSLLAYDPSLGRVSVFAPDSGRSAYTTTFGPRLKGGPPWQVQRTQANDGLVALFRPGFAFVPGADFSNRRDHVRLLELDGSAQRDLVTFPSKSFLVAGTSITPHPFGHEGFAKLDQQDRLHVVWSDSLAVTTYDLEGNRLASFRLDYRPPAITSTDVENAAMRFSDQGRQGFSAVLQDSLPVRWPAVRDVLIDDSNRIWLALSGPLTAPVEWIALSAEGAYLGSMLAPAGSDVRLIRSDGTVYAQRLDENDVPHVVVYRMVRPLR